MAIHKSHPHQKTITHVTIGLLVLAVLLFHFCSPSSCIHAAGGPTFSDILPVDGDRFLKGGEVMIYFFVSGRNDISVSTYFAKGTAPTESDLMDRHEGVDRRYSWVVPPSMLEEGIYYWYSTATDGLGTTSTGTKSFTVYSQSPALVESTTPEGGRDSSTGGKGGHQSDRLGEKTAFFYTVYPGSSTEVSFSNNVKTHGIRSLTFHAIDPLPGGNGFLVHQEFDAFFHDHPEQGVDSALKESDEKIINPFFFGLPTDIIPYKAIHVHDTDDWVKKGTRFYTTVRFEIPKKWLASHNLSRENVSIQRYEKSLGMWIRMQVNPEGEGESSYYYRTTLNGIPPFVIGGSPNSYYGGTITPTGK